MTCAEVELPQFPELPDQLHQLMVLLLLRYPDGQAMIHGLVAAATREVSVLTGPNYRILH